MLSVLCSTIHKHSSLFVTATRTRFPSFSFHRLERIVCSILVGATLEPFPRSFSIFMLVVYARLSRAACVRACPHSWHQEGNKPRRLRLGASRHDRLENDQEGCAAATPFRRFTRPTAGTGRKISFVGRRTRPGLVGRRRRRQRAMQPATRDFSVFF